MSWKDDTKTNPNDLYNEWLDIVDLWNKYGEEQVNAINKHTKLTEQLSYIIAKYDKEIRLDPQRFSLLKIAETPVQRAIERQKAVVEKKEEVSNAKREVELYSKVIIPALKLKVETLKELSRKADGEIWASRASHKNSGVVDEIKDRARARREEDNNFDDVEFDN